MSEGVFNWPRDLALVPLDDWLRRIEAANEVLPSLPIDAGEWWSRSWEIQFYAKALTDYCPPKIYLHPEAKAAIAPFVAWLAERSDTDVLKLAWELLTHRGEDLGSSVIGELNHMGRLRGPLNLQNLELAVSFAQDAEAMYSWPDDRWQLTEWERLSPPYIDSLNHQSYVVRGCAAKALGQLCIGCLEHGKQPPFVQWMALILEQESRTPGVAGAFLNGTGWLCGSEDVLPKDYDYRTLFLDALRRGGEEPDIPYVQTLEFYAHEFFDMDADGIREILRMGRRYLAVMTATDLPAAIPTLLPVLREMAASDDPEVSAAITEYLRDPGHHGGLDLVRTRP